MKFSIIIIYFFFFFIWNSKNFYFKAINNDNFFPRSYKWKNDFEDFKINKIFLFIIILLLKMILMLIEKLKISLFLLVNKIPILKEEIYIKERLDKIKEEFEEIK